jgi:hypothetical protein
MPGRLYAVHGAGIDTVLADARGRATLTVDLGARTEVRLLPLTA